MELDLIPINRKATSTPGLDLVPLKSPKRSVTSDIKESTIEAAKQFPKAYVTGALGSVGDILELIRAQSPGQTPGAEAKHEREASIASRLSQEGYVPTLGELEDLTSNEEPLGRQGRFPTTRSASEFAESLGATGEPKTTAGRFAKRIGQFAGGSQVLGAGALVPAAAATAGQTAEELGAPPWAQAAVEIATLIKGGRSKSPVSAKDPKIAKELEKLRNQGFTEHEITLAKNALEDHGFLTKAAKYTDKTAKQFKDTIKSLETKSNELIGKAFPGIEQGIEAVEHEASNLYKQMNNLAEDVSIRKGTPFIKAAENVKGRLQRTLANTPEEKQMLQFLDDAILGAELPSRGDYYTRFYRSLNKLGRWVDPSEREHIFTELKDAIKATFRESGPEGKRLASELEKANVGWKQFRQAEDFTKFMGKMATEEGINYSKLAKSLENPRNYDLVKESLGPVGAKRFNQLAKVGSKIGDLEKALEGGTAKQILGGAKSYKLVKAIATFDLGALKEYVAAESIGRISNKLLTDPAYQRLHIRLLEKIAEQKWNEVRVIGKEFEKKIEKDQKSEG